MPLLQRARQIVTFAIASTTLAGVLGAQVIDTRNGQSVTNGGYLLGGTNSFYAFQSIGESFVVQNGFADLQSFSFFLSRVDDVPSSLDFSFYATIQAFDGTAAVGPALFTSSVHTRLGTEPIGPGSEEVFSTGGLALTPGATYIAMLQATPTNSGAGRGVAFYSNNTYPAGVIASNQAYSGFTGSDLAFVARFGPAGVTTTPEPATFVLLGTGLLAVGGVARRRRKR